MHLMSKLIVEGFADATTIAILQSGDVEAMIRNGRRLDAETAAAHLAANPPAALVSAEEIAREIAAFEAVHGPLTSPE